MNVNERASAYTTQIISTMINSGWFDAGDGIADQQTATANVANVTAAYNALFDAVLNRLVVRRQVVATRQPIPGGGTSDRARRQAGARRGQSKPPDLSGGTR